MTHSLQDLESRVQQAHRAGARAAEFLEHTWSGNEVVLQDRRTVTSSTSQDATLSVRCWLERGQTGEATGHPDQVDKLIDRALAAAEKAPDNPFAGPVERLDPPAHGLGIDDRRYGQLTREDRHDVVVNNHAAAGKIDPRVRTGRFTYSDRRSRRVFANSRGVAMEFDSTLYEADGLVSLRVGDGPIELSERVAGRAFTSTACLPFGATLARSVASLAEETTAIDGPIRVLLRPRATAALVAWLAEQVMAPELPGFLRGRGGQVFHRRLHIVDDGSLPGGLNTRAFDDRGVPPVPLTIVREGRLDARPIDPESARQLGARPTGHCRAGRMAPTNLQLHAGMRSINAHLGEQTGPVFAISHLPDLSGIDTQTGAVDVIVHGHVWRGHDNLGARRFARLQGDLITALQGIAGVASDTDRIRHVDAPGIFIDGFSVVG